MSISVTGWGEVVAARLVDTALCPVCARARLRDGCCPRCGADLRGPVGQELWRASAAAANAVRERELVLERVPRRGGRDAR